MLFHISKWLSTDSLSPSLPRSLAPSLPLSLSLSLPVSPPSHSQI